MLTRRQTVAGLISAATGGAVLSAGAFTSSVSAGADMRVIVVSNLLLEPAREDESYVETDEDGLVESIALTELNSSAISRFADLVRVRNEGTVDYEELSFEFEAYDSNEDRWSELEEALQILINGTELDGIGDEERIAVDGLEPGGDGVPFGVLVNLNPNTEQGIGDLPDDGVDVQLHVNAHSE